MILKKAQILKFRTLKVSIICKRQSGLLAAVRWQCLLTTCSFIMQIFCILNLLFTLEASNRKLLNKSCFKNAIQNPLPPFTLRQMGFQHARKMLVRNLKRKKIIIFFLTCFMLWGMTAVGNIWFLFLLVLFWNSSLFSPEKNTEPNK